MFDSVIKFILRSNVDLSVAIDLTTDDIYNIAFVRI